MRGDVLEGVWARKNDKAPIPAQGGKVVHNKGWDVVHKLVGPSRVQDPRVSAHHGVWVQPLLLLVVVVHHEALPLHIGRRIGRHCHMELAGPLRIHVFLCVLGRSLLIRVSKHARRPLALIATRHHRGCVSTGDVLQPAGTEGGAPTCARPPRTKRELGDCKAPRVWRPRPVSSCFARTGASLLLCAPHPYIADSAGTLGMSVVAVARLAAHLGAWLHVGGAPLHKVPSVLHLRFHGASVDSAVRESTAAHRQAYCAAYVFKLAALSHLMFVGQLQGKAQRVSRRGRGGSGSPQLKTYRV
eukprot:scaffold3275_cov385-Prasinococcus_capsulatus_cf.AAC.6